MTLIRPTGLQSRLCTGMSLASTGSLMKRTGPHSQAVGDVPTLGTMTIDFAPFNVWYPIADKSGTFLERVVFGAFTDATRGDLKGIRVQFNHGAQDPRPLGPIVSLVQTSNGPRATVALLDTSYGRDLLPGLRSGLYGASFRFIIPSGGEKWVDRPPKSTRNPAGLPERTIAKVDLYEFGPVVWPANPSATAVARVSSLTAKPAAKPAAPAAGRVMNHRARREALYPMLRKRTG